MDTFLLPEIFLKRLPAIIPSECVDSVRAAFSRDRVLSLRVNTLKAEPEEVFRHMDKDGIKYTPVPWYKSACIVEDIAVRSLSDHGLVKKRLVYIQSLSSMLPAVVLAPQPGECVLDLCAAPGSKATQMAAMMNNEGTIFCVEPIRDRFYKLRSVIEQMDVHNAVLKMTDGRKFRSVEQFDKVLVDAPCSSEGRFRLSDKKSYAFWSLRKIKEMVQKQRGLLLNASRLLKPGGTLVYSTCTFAPEENEGVVDWLLRKTKNALYVEPAAVPGVAAYPAIVRWGEKDFSPDVRKCLRVLPSGDMEGFFVAKMIKQPFTTRTS